MVGQLMERLVGQLVKQGEHKSSAIRDLGEILVVLGWVRECVKSVRKSVSFGGWEWGLGGIFVR